MKLKGLAQRRANRLSGREKVNHVPPTPRIWRKAIAPPMPVIPIPRGDAEKAALKLLRSIVLGPDDKLDDALARARALLERPITPPASAPWTMGGKPIVSVVVSNEAGVIAQVRIRPQRLAALGEFCAELIESWSDETSGTSEPEYHI